MGIGGDVIGVVVGDEVMPHGREEHNQSGSGQQQAYKSRMKRQARPHRARSRVACGRRWGHLRWVSHRASSSQTRGMKKGDLSKFIEEAVLWRVFHRTVQDIKARNADT